MRLALCLSFALPFLLAACKDDCNRSGEQAMREVVKETDHETRLAGNTAYLDDIIDDDGCVASSRHDMNIWLYRVPAPIHDDTEAKAFFDGNEPVLKHYSRGRYNLVVESGDYLVCALNTCLNVAVEEGRTTTVNLALSAYFEFRVALPDGESTVRNPGDVAHPTIPLSD